jgi:hypothetical protein
LPIATLLSVRELFAPYFLESNIDGETDIVLTFPMRKHGVFNGATLTNQIDPNSTACQGDLNDGIDDGQTVSLPSLDASVQDYPQDETGGLCENVGYVENLNDYDSSKPDTLMQVHYYDYEEQESKIYYEPWIITPFPYPFVDNGTIALERSVNVITIHRNSGGSTGLFGTPDENSVSFTFDSGFEAGWLRFLLAESYSYETTSSMSALTEPVGGLGSGVTNSWTGVPIIGFAAMTSVIQAGQLGETIELTLKKNRD